jgi:hypothetical protein
VKRWQLLGAIGSLPLFLVAAVWQAGNFAVLAAEARALESEQRQWLDANRKLAGGIAVLESRERAAELATRLGLVRAAAPKRIFIVTPRKVAGMGDASEKKHRPSAGGNDG